MECQSEWSYAPYSYIVKSEFKFTLPPNNQLPLLHPLACNSFFCCSSYTRRTQTPHCNMWYMYVYTLQYAQTRVYFGVIKRKKKIDNIRLSFLVGNSQRDKVCVSYFWNARWYNTLWYSLSDGESPKECQLRFGFTFSRLLLKSRFKGRKLNSRAFRQFESVNFHFPQ